MDQNTASLLRMTSIMVGIGSLLAAAGFPQLGLSIILLGCAPFGFLGLLAIGIYGDKLFGAEDAWAYTLPTASTPDDD